MVTKPLKVAVLISGRGSNLQALIDHFGPVITSSPIRIVKVISNRPDAGGIERAKKAGIPTAVFDHKTFPDRVAFDATLAKLQRLRFYYAGLVQTSVIAAPVATQLQDQYRLTTAQVEGAVNTLMGADTFTIDLFAQGRNPQESSAIAQAATAELIDYVKRQQKDLGIPTVQRVTLTEVTTPSAGIKVKVSTKKQLVSAGVAFVVVGAAFMIVADLLRRRW